MPRLHATLLASGLVLAFAACASTAATDSTKPATAQADAALDAAIADPARDPKNVLRDVHRHPRETLGFFQVKPDATIIEISPSGGWYSEILAPYLRDDGRYVAATGAAPADSGGGKRNAALQAKFAAAPARYDRVQWLEYDGKAPVLGAPGAADVVLTFRNVHNWRSGGQAEGYFKAFFDVLKPGGVLGVVEHRARADVPADDSSGYVGQDQVIALATAAGFQLLGTSEVNANPADTKDHPNGVWTLPPVGRHEPAEAARYQAIGESDRMTLRFVKPAG